MSAATVTRFRNRVGWKDLAWVAWRQHRSAILGIGILVLAIATCMALVGTAAASRGSARISVLMFDSLTDPASTLGALTVVYSALIAVFWAAPLLSREYEQRTHLLAWGQDVSAARWLAGKAAVLCGTAVVLALVLGTTARLMAVLLDSKLNYFNPFEDPYFEAVPLVQVGYTLFGFALGLTISAIARKTVLSMGLTLGVFIVVRAFVAIVVRPYYLTPLRAKAPFESAAYPQVPDDSLRVGSGYLNAAGDEIEYPTGCSAGRGSGRDAYYDCLRQKGIVSSYSDFHPIDRLGTFHLIEFGIFTALAVVLFVATWRLTRRVKRL